MSDWVATSTSPSNLAALGAEAVEEALRYPGQVATLIAPANHAWDGGAIVAPPVQLPAPSLAADHVIAETVAALQAGGRTALFLGGRALRQEALNIAGRISRATGATLMCETFPARLQRGAGCVEVTRLAYFGEVAATELEAFDTIVLVGAPAPVSFFAYPDKPSWLSPPNAQIITLATPHDDATHTLARLAVALGATAQPQVATDADRRPWATN